MDVTDDERMRAAVDLAAGRPNPAAERLRRAGTRNAIVLRILTVLALVGFVLLLPLPASERVDGPGSALGSALSGIGVLVVVGATFWARRTGEAGSGWQRPTYALTYRQRRDVRRQVLGRRPVRTAQLPLTRALAAETVRQLPMIMVALGFLLLVLGGALRMQTTMSWVFVAVVAMAAAANTWQILRDRSRAARFLRDHPALATEVLS